MTREQIEKAAEEYAGLTDNPKDPNVREKGARCIAFKDGANWRINSVWHTPDEMPRVGSYVVALYEDEHIYSGKVRDYCNSVPVKTWAYIDDLMPETKEE